MPHPFTAHPGTFFLSDCYDQVNVTSIFIFMFLDDAHKYITVGVWCQANCYCHDHEFFNYDQVL